MRIATKITTGYGVLIALMIALLIYHVSLIHHMETINRNLSEVNLRTAMASLQLMRDLDQLEEFTRKFFVTQDPRYATMLKELQEIFVNDLQAVKSLGRSDKERVEIERLSQIWNEFSAAAPWRQDPAVQGVQSPEVEAALPNLLDHLSRLRTQTETLMETTREAIESQVEKSAQASQQAERIAWMAPVVALLLSVLVSWLIVRSISGPLHQLTEGTRAIAEGKFSYQLEASGTDELSQLAEDFNSMAQRLNELDQMKQDFVSHVSHELKAPLASMRETIQLLLEQIPGPLTDKQKRLLELNFHSGKRLSSMIGNLLDLSRMEAGVMEYELKKQDLVALMRIVLAEFEVRAREKNLRLEAEFPPQPVIVECDGDRIIQVIANLLENAWKFSPPGAAIGVSVRVVAKIPEQVPTAWRPNVFHAASGDGCALVAVSDSGPGVPNPHKEKIFEKFHQVKQGKKISGQGVGLGLAICRTIMEAHHGAIWVEDNPGGGSVFLVLLPARAVGEWVEHRASAPM